MVDCTFTFTLCYVDGAQQWSHYTALSLRLCLISPFLQSNWLKLGPPYILGKIFQIAWADFYVTFMHCAILSVALCDHVSVLFKDCRRRFWWVEVVTWPSNCGHCRWLSRLHSTACCRCRSNWHRRLTTRRFSHWQSHPTTNWSHLDHEIRKLRLLLPYYFHCMLLYLLLSLFLFYLIFRLSL